MAFCYMGADKVPSAIISIIYGTSPLVSGLISSFLLRRERFSVWQWLGLGIALVGMSFTLGLSSSGFQLNRIGIVLELIAMLFYVLSTFAVKSVGAHIPPITQMTGATLVSWVGYVCLLPFFWSHLPTEFPSLKISLAVLYSAVFICACHDFLLSTHQNTTTNDCATYYHYHPSISHILGNMVQP